MGNKYKVCSILDIDYLALNVQKAGWIRESKHKAWSILKNWMPLVLKLGGVVVNH